MLVKNVASMGDAITRHVSSFQQKDMFNLVTFAVPPQQVKETKKNRD